MKYFLIILLCISLNLNAKDFKKEYLVIHNKCEICYSTQNLRVYIIDKNNKNKYDWSNYITLCESNKLGFNCYRDIGHGGNFNYHNPLIWDDIFTIHKIILTNKSKNKLKKQLFDYKKSIKERLKTINEINSLYTKCLSK